MRLSPAARVMAVYAAAGAVWIVLSDRALSLVAPSELGTLGQTAKGLAFVVVTSALVYALVRASHRRLERSEARYRAVFEANPDTVLLIDPSGLVVDVNSHGLTHHKMERADLVGKKVEGLAPEPLAREARARFEEARERHVEFSWQYPLPDGSLLALAISARPLELDGQRYVVADVRDMTDALRAQERFEAIFTKSTDPMCLADLDAFQFIKVNAAFTEALGHSAGELLSRPFLDFVHPDDIEGTVGAVENKLRRGESLLRFENRYRTAAGAYRWFEWVSHVVPSEGIVFAIAHDVTQRKEEERLLREREERLNLALEAAGLGAWDWRPQTGELIFDARWAGMLGYGVDELEGRIDTWRDLTHPEDAPQAMAVVEAHLCGETPVAVTEFRMRHKAGYWVWILSHSKIMERDAEGKAVRACGTHLDITERKRMEAALQESESRYRTVSDNYPSGGLFLFDRDLRHVVAGGRGIEDVGRTAEELEGRTIYEAWPPEVCPMLEELCAAAFRGERGYAEGHYAGRYYENTAAPVRNSAGDVLHALVIAQEVTGRKQAEEALRASETRYREIFEHAHDAILVFGEEGRIVEANPQAAQLYGYSQETLTQLTGEDIVHPDYHHVFQEFLTKASSEGVFEAESVDVRNNGETFDIEVRGTGFDHGGEPRLLALVRDITESKRAREALLESEAKYRAYVGHSPVGIFITDDEGNYLDANPAACAMLGYERPELLTRSVTDVGPALEGGGDFAVLREQGHLRGEIQLRRRDGEPVYAILDAVALGGGRYMGFCTDISRRRAAEARVDHLNAMLRSLRHVDRLITDAQDQQSLIEGVCEGLTRERGFHSAWAALMEDGGAVRSVACVGLGDAESQLRQRLLTGELPRCAVDALRSDSAVCVKRKASDCEFCPFLEEEASTASMAACLTWQGVTFGVLVASVPARMAGDAEELALFEELAADVSYALRSLELEQARRQEEERRRLFERIVSNVRAPLVFLDAEARYRAVNEDYLRRFKLTWEEIDGETPAAVVGDEIHVRRIVPALTKCLAGEEVRYEAWYVFPDLGERCMVYQYFPYYDGSNRVAGTIIIGADITDVKRAEEAVRRSEAELLAFFNSTQDAIYLKDGEFRYVRINYALEELFGLPAREILGKTDFDLFAPEEAAEIRAVDERLLAGERAHGEHVRVLRGEERHVESVKAPVRDGEGNIVGLCGVTRDITERKRLEDQLRQAQKMEAIGQLAGGVAHDFNNLLQVINGHVDLMLMEMPQDAPLREDLEEIEKAGGRAAGLVGQLLAFSRRQIMNPQDLNLNDVVSDLMKMLVRVLGEHIRIEFVPGHRLGITRGDRGMMEQVVMNLCVNARDAMPEGGSLLIETQNVFMDADYCEHHAWASPGRHVLLSITDTGSGMDEETMARVFEPFFTTKDPGRGTGLGLSTVYGVVHQHDGEVQVYSEVGKGTKFKIYLPVVERTATDVDSKIEGAPEGGSETILLAEDDAMVANLAQRTLERAGYTVLTARDGEEAVLLFRQNRNAIDLCLFDVIMPRLGGKDAYERIQRIREDVPVLYASGYSENVVHTNFVLREGLALLQKPFSCDHLLRTVRGVLDGDANAGG